MRKSDFTFIFVLALFLLPIPTIAKHDASATEMNDLASHEILLNPVSWESFTIQCDEGETLSGSFLVTQDGSLYIGDDTRYEYWLLEGVDFFICNSSSYESWIDGNEVETLFIREDVSELNWSVTIPSSGEWYIVYWNDTIYMKTLEGNFFRERDISAPIIAAVLAVGIVALIILLGIVVRSIRS